MVQTSSDIEVYQPKQTGKPKCRLGLIVGLVVLVALIAMIGVIMILESGSNKIKVSTEISTSEIYDIDPVTDSKTRDKEI